MATFLKGRRKVTKEDDSLPPPPPELNGSGLAASGEAPPDRTQPVDTPVNNTTEFEVINSCVIYSQSTRNSLDSPDMSSKF